MSDKHEPLSNFPVFRSTDPEFVRDKLLNVFGARSYQIGSDPDEFSSHANHLRLKDSSISYGANAAAVTVGFPDAGFIRQIFNIDGGFRFNVGRLEGDVSGAHWTPVIPDQVPLVLEFERRHQHLGLRIESEALQSHLNSLVGIASDRKLEFVDTGERRNPAMSNLRRRLFHFAFDFNTRGNLFSDLAAAEVERAVIVGFLLAHEHNYTHFLLREPAPALRSNVRVVEEYIEANWDKPLDIATLAGVANVSARSLFRQFRKEPQYSPAEFAKRVRLQRAFEMLLQPESETTVTQVALKCGFQNQGHFAKDFRSAFGERPSDTLAAGLRGRS